MALNGAHIAALCSECLPVLKYAALLGHRGEQQQRVDTSLLGNPSSSLLQRGDIDDQR